MARQEAPRLSSDPRIRVFDRIAWIYGLLFRVQRLSFRRNLRALRRQLPLSTAGLPSAGLRATSRALDIGCGTGAHASVLAQMGYEVCAVDASPRMVAAASRLLRRGGCPARAEGLCVAVADPLEGLQFPDRHFDLVLAAHVVHGMPAQQRRRFYREARRVCRDLVLVFDFSPRTHATPGFVARVLEALERSDYRRFRRSGLRELRACFQTVQVIRASPASAWYLCRSRRRGGLTPAGG